MGAGVEGVGRSSVGVMAGTRVGVVGESVGLTIGRLEVAAMFFIACGVHETHMQRITIRVRIR
jgi:hypothetical protein